MTQTTMTVAERDFVNHSIHFGPAALTRKMGRHWKVGHGEMQHPKLFKTKHEAIDAVYAWLDAIALRRRAN